MIWLGRKKQSCCRFAAHLWDLNTGLLSSAEEEQLKSHLSTCPDCTAEYVFVGRALSASASMREVPYASYRHLQELLDKLAVAPGRAETRQRRVPLPALSALGLAMAACVSWPREELNSKQVVPPVQDRIVTGPGRHADITLPHRLAGPIELTRRHLANRLKIGPSYVLAPVPRARRAPTLSTVAGQPASGVGLANNRETKALKPAQVLIAAEGGTFIHNAPEFISGSRPITDPASLVTGSTPDDESSSGPLVSVETVADSGTAP